ncbi:DUF1566 domain-containing protein [Vibrio sp. 99-70-13A1]|uniref:Lcl C-terminal domain-containing protein n=1 Tax=Vibrio sp. 99-70-13A1 TaxID=2607601 RepID=UPI001493340F|nr:DUF1566 domain-containing protein [Vibrio sp. 99-70-13A1]NOH95163.1 DUF1566 domain-containing protein [Vibrio sp. 99-70-13A1]
MRIQKSHWQLNKISAALLVLAIAGCKSGHEGSGDDGTPTDPDPTTPVQVSIPSTASFSEPTSGSNTESITVTLSEALSSELNLTISTSDITARSEGAFKNFDSISAQVITIPAGSTSASLPLNILHNNLHEANKTLQYSISADSSDDYELSNTLSTVTITDADAEPTVSFSHSNKVVLEGDTAQSNIELSHYSYKDITVTLEQTGIATDDDYTSNLTSLTVQINAESLSSPISITAKQDGLSEGGETVIYKMIASGNAVIDTSSDTLSFYIPGDNQINDTGYVNYFDGANFDSQVAPTSYPNQDAEYGLDSADGTNHADGQHGFKFTKLDYSGNILPNNASDWSCVRDERTGMYIEAKQQPIDLPNQSVIDQWLEDYADDPDANPYPYSTESAYWRSSAYLYTWYDSVSTTNGGSAGHKNDELLADGPISSACAYSTVSGGDRRCDTEGYLANLNSFGVCGINNWRLPSPAEARSFINYNVGTIDPTTVDFFSYINNANSVDTIYTQSTSAGATSSAWCMNTQTGQMKLCNKGTYRGVIAVSGVVE